MRRASGFSLIEMLVTLLIIVLAVSLVTLNVGGGGGERELRARVDDLASLAEYALDEAQASGTDFGLRWVTALDDRGNEQVMALWRQRLPQGWREPRVSLDLFQAIAFPAEVEVQLFLDGVEMLIDTRGAADAANGRAPQWLFLASGETQSGELMLRSEKENSTLGLRWDALARFEAIDESGVPIDDGSFASQITSSR